MASALISLLLFAFGLSASKQLHKNFHSDADNPQHECIVTVLSNGGVDLVAADAPVLQPTEVVVPFSRVQSVVCTSIDYRLPPDRGPPVFVS